MSSQKKSPHKPTARSVIGVFAGPYPIPGQNNRFDGPGTVVVVQRISIADFSSRSLLKTVTISHFIS